MSIKTTGEQREFSTGAHRDASNGKGRIDLIPSYVLEKVMNCSKENLLIDILNIDELLIAIQYNIIDFVNNEKIESLVLATKYSILAAGVNTVEKTKIIYSEKYHQYWGEGILALSHHYEDGAVLHGENNWKHGMPTKIYYDSGMRHLYKCLACWVDEPHFAALAWNLTCLVWTLKYKPELNNLSELE